jgi:outer membrane murein-binding lipoprotein Lpp
MSTPPPPDRPTEPLRRARPVPVEERVMAPAPVVEERVVAPAVDPSVLLLRLEDAIDNLRTWLVVIGLVAVVALGVALYALLDDDTSRSAGGSPTGVASDERVSQIENRVDRLSRQLQDVRADGAGGDDTSALAARIDQLESAIKSQSGQGADTSGTQDAIDELSSRIDDLAGDVEQLKSSQTTP